MAAENIRHLLLVAKKAIPRSLWAHTPVTIKATAGLRLLPEDKAEGILYHVSQIFAGNIVLRKISYPKKFWKS